VYGLSFLVPSLSVSPPAHEQQEAQRPPGWEAPQTLQSAQQAAEAGSTGCECPQGMSPGNDTGPRVKRERTTEVGRGHLVNLDSGRKRTGFGLSAILGSAQRDFRRCGLGS
jgi:hypothetical protein